jgi:hypothetical protein
LAISQIDLGDLRERSVLRREDCPHLPWSFVNLFQRKAERIDRALDDNETGCRGQDG